MLNSPFGCIVLSKKTKDLPRYIVNKSEIQIRNPKQIQNSNVQKFKTYVLVI